MHIFSRHAQIKNLASSLHALLQDKFCGVIEENRLRNKKVYAFTNLVVHQLYISPGVIKWILLYNYCLAASDLPRIFAISQGASLTVGGLVLRSDGLARPLIGQLVSNLYCKVVGIISALSRKPKIRFLNPGNSMTIFIIPETSQYIDKINKSPHNLFVQYVGFSIFLKHLGTICDIFPAILGPSL